MLLQKVMIKPQLPDSKITEIESYGAADVYTVKNKGSEVLFAFVEGIFNSVDTKAKKVVVNSQILEEVMV